MNPNTAHAITLRQIRAFIAVAREGSFTRASETIHLTQPALTTCIRQLEDHVGVPLFERTTRNVALNRYGSAFLPIVERIVRDLDTALDDVRALQQGERGQVTIATVPSIASSILPSTVTQFAMSHPGVGITLTEDHSEGVRRKVLEGEAEFGLSGTTELSIDVEAKPIFYDTVGLFCSSAHPLAELDRPLCWADLAGQEIFNMGYQTQLHAIIDVVPELAITLSQTTYKVRNTLTTLSLIRSRNAIAALPRLSIPPDSQGDVIFRPLNEPELKREIFLCRDSRKPLSAPAVALIGLIRQNAEDAGATLYDWQSSKA